VHRSSAGATAGFPNLVSGFSRRSDATFMQLTPDFRIPARASSHHRTRTQKPPGALARGQAPGNTSWPPTHRITPTARTQSASIAMRTPSGRCA
jgi:hypothetical protein